MALAIGSVVRIVRANPRQGNGWSNSIMGPRVGDGRLYTVRTYERNPRFSDDPDCLDGARYYYLTLDGRDIPCLWSARSLDVRTVDGWVAADPRDAAGVDAPVVAPPPSPKHTIRTNTYSPPIVAKSISVEVTDKDQRPWHVLSCASQNYALGCCGWGQLSSFSGLALTPSGLREKEVAKMLTAKMAGEWLAAIINAQKYGSYLPLRAVFCYTPAQKVYLTIRFLKEFLGAKEVFAEKSYAHSPYNTLHTCIVELNCPELVRVSYGSIGEGGVVFSVQTDDKLDPQGRFKEWINGL